MRVPARPVFTDIMDSSGKNEYSTEPEQYYPDSPEQHPDGMEESLLEHMPDDARLDSGVPSEQRGADLDSIMMSGLTTPEPAGETATLSLVPDARNPSAPVSFYEKGVDDVDSARGPDALEDTHHADADLIIRPTTVVLPDSSVADSFRDMIAEFSAETDTENEDKESADPPHDTTHVKVDQEEPAETTETNVVEAVETIPIEEEVADPAGVSEPDQSSPHVDEIPEVEPEPTPEPPRSEPIIQPVPLAAEPPHRSVASITNISTLARKSPDSPALAEAESLVRQLEDQQLAPAQSDTPTLLQDWTFPERAEDDIANDNDNDNGATPSGRRRSSGQRSARRRLIRWTVRMVVLAILTAVGYQGYLMYQIAMATDVEQFNRANARLAAGAYAEAAALFISLPEHYAGSPLTADAQFMGAYALTRVPGISGDAPQAYADAVLRLQQFIGNNPDHPKRHRAETLLGVMYYRTQDFEQAITVLRDPQLQKFDRQGYLPGLRILARAYSAVGDVDRAHTAYLRAASLEENRSPDEDFLELAAMYEQRAQHADTTELQQRYLRAAVDQWDVALRLPGLLKSRRKAIRQRRDIVAEELGGGLIMEDGTPVPTAFEESMKTEVSEKVNHQQMEQQLLFVD